MTEIATFTKSCDFCGFERPSFEAGGWVKIEGIWDGQKNHCDLDFCQMSCGAGWILRRSDELSAVG